VTVDSLLRTLVAALHDAGIPFMLTGSVASAYHGAGRATMDIDLVIDPQPSQLTAFLTRIEGSGVYVSAEAAREALAQRTMFNVVDPESGWKADLIVRKARAFSETEFARRQPIEFLGLTMSVAAVEDVIVSKLEWAKLGASARQIDDVRALLHIQGDEIDRAYVARWVRTLGLETQWADATTVTRA
jgi:hypothetical protein